MSVKPRTTIKPGLVFSRLTVLKETKRPTNSAHRYWLCQCECGNKTKARSSSLTSKQVQSCGCLIQDSALRKQASEKARNPMASWRQVWHGYRTAAKRRNLEFELDLSMFKQLCEQDCHYCGAAPAEDKTVYNMHKKKYPDALFRMIYRNGVDRVDNSKGYVLSNCVACCSTCNLAKRTMTAEVFTNWTRRVALKTFNLNLLQGCNP